MKVRQDFVTNSSSSSFIISKKCLDEDQVEAIRKHGLLGQKLHLDNCSETWDISENNSYITAYTSMDNFDMDEFLQIIDVDYRNVKWGEDPFSLTEDKNWRDLLHENQI